MRTVLRLGGGALAAVLAYLAVTFVQVALATRHDGVRPAQALVVLGAAQYNGQPSPVFRERLEHTAQLYGRDIAPLVVVTGGNRPGDRFTEASAAATYLATRGVPQDALLWVTTGRSTWESLAATARVLRERDMNDVVLVSDPFHAYRAAAIAGDIGLTAAVSPTPTSRVTGAAMARQLARETLAVGLGRVIGYRRLDNASLFVSQAG